MNMRNLDERTVRSFGAQWSAYDQDRLSADERTARRFAEYFAIFPWDGLPEGTAIADVGCGSGRWALLVSPRVGTLHCIDASDEALAAAHRNLAGQPNCRFHHASVDAIPLPPGSMDFCYSLGVLHHVPDTMAGIEACVTLLKPGALCSSISTTRSTIGPGGSARSGKGLTSCGAAFLASRSGLSGP